MRICYTQGKNQRKGGQLKAFFKVFAFILKLSVGAKLFGLSGDKVQ
jgi:hypothetical protein